MENLIVNKEQRIPDIALFTGAPRSGLDRGHADLPQPGVPHELLGPHGLLGLTQQRAPARVRGYVNTAAASLYPTTPPSRIWHGPRAPSRLRASLRRRPDFGTASRPRGTRCRASARGSGRAADRRGPGQGGLLRGRGLQRSPRPRATSGTGCSTAGSGIPAAAGTDAMANYASLRGPVGMNRVFAKVEGPARARGVTWPRSRRGGPWPRTVPSSSWRCGRFGRRLDRAGRRDRAARGQAPARGAGEPALDRARRQARAWCRTAGSWPRCPSRGTAPPPTPWFPCPIERSGWYVLRAYASRSRHPVLDLYPFGTTSPVYVAVGGAPARSPEDARYFLGWIDRVSDVRGGACRLQHSRREGGRFSRRSPRRAPCGRSSRRTLPDGPKLLGFAREPRRAGRASPSSALGGPRCSAGDHGRPARGQQPRQASRLRRVRQPGLRSSAAEPRPGAPDQRPAHAHPDAERLALRGGGLSGARPRRRRDRAPPRARPHDGLCPHARARRLWLGLGDVRLPPRSPGARPPGLRPDAPGPRQEVTTDVPTAFFTVFALWAFWRLLRGRGGAIANLLACALGSAGALVSKYTSVLLFVAFGLLLIVEAVGDARRSGRLDRALSACAPANPPRSS